MAVTKDISTTAQRWATNIITGGDLRNLSGQIVIDSEWQDESGGLIATEKRVIVDIAELAGEAPELIGELNTALRKMCDYIFKRGENAAIS